MSDYLRPYQLEARDAVLNDLQTAKSSLIVLPTGAGKTETILDIFDHWHDRDCDILGMAHRRELIHQPFDRWHRKTGEYAQMEMGEYRRSNLRGASRLTFASKDSLHPDRLRAAFPDPRRMGLIFVDEAHHCVRKAGSFSHVIDYFMSANPNCRLVGATATPDRADEEALGTMFEMVSYDYPLYDPTGGPSAITDGWLVPIHQEYISTEIDFSAVKTRAGDFVDGQLQRAVSEDRHLYKMTAGMLEIIKSGLALVFCSGIEHAIRQAMILNTHSPNNAYALASSIPEHLQADFVVHSQDSESRRSILKSWGNEQFQYMVNCGVLTEGFDEPKTKFVVMGRPTQSRALYSQMCLSHDTEILTPDGWKKRGQIVAGDNAMSFNMTTGEVEVQAVSDVADRPLDSDEYMLHLDTPHLDICVTNKHDMVVKTRSGRLNAYGAWRKEECETALKHADGFRIPVAGLMNFKGVQLSDAAVGDNMDKEISDDILWNATREQWRVLLYAMHLSNGSKPKEINYVQRSYHIVTRHKRHADRMQIGCMLRGLQCNINAFVNANGTEMYFMHIRDAGTRTVSTSQKDRPTFKRLSSYTENVWCVTVPNGAILTRRNGKVAIVGNCGRGTRILPNVIEGIRPTGERWRLDTPEERKAAIAASGKPHVTILDFVGVSGKHKLISSIDILGGKVSDDIVEQAKKRVMQKKSSNVEDALRDAVSDIEEEMKQRRKIMVETHAVHRKQISPWDVLGTVVPTREPGWHKGRKPTEKMKNALRKFKVSDQEIAGLTFTQASVMMDKLIQRIKDRLCTYSQAKFLMKHGENPDVSFDVASSKINQIMSRYNKR